MDNFKIIYKILKILEKSMDYEEFDVKMIYPEALDINKHRWTVIMCMLIQNEYITNASIVNVMGETGVKINRNIQITLKGLEYLEENSFMRKAKNAV